MIGAEHAGIHVDEQGFIPVDKQQRTNVSTIFAIGDIVGNPNDKNNNSTSTGLQCNT